MARTTARRVEKSADAYRSIGEAAEELGLQTHVLRYWETKFGKFVKPLKRRDGRRMFRPEDMAALRAIQILVHERGLTLKGALNLLNEQSVAAVLEGDVNLVSAPAEAKTEDPVDSPARALQETVAKSFDAKFAPAERAETGRKLEAVLADLTDIKARLDAARLRKAA
ncbi:MerR family transcriptional regulator [Hyphomonas sp. FCG-A18]|uniref:MerR family transcriptional regulator n=1 Tax=Hyphomonas sp. FCG-A18 TaxID=3080019 RepID=UPI002B2A0C85|nr:MerR family transcriptional regulator [Hyphomonas sp. FCG-A18]